MELVYLWVEDYKNIHRQGFNFSPRFRCEFNEEKSELIICDKENKDCKEKEECKKFCNEPYLKNFFADNVNVTAIVGKNGSGKSSVLLAIKELINIDDSRHFSITTKSFLLYSKNNKIYCLKNSELKIGTNQDIIISDKFHINPNIFSFFSEMPYNTFSFLNNESSGDWLMTPKEFLEMQRSEFADLSIERIGEILVGNKGDIYSVPKLNFNPVKVSIQNNSNFTQVIKNDLGVYIAKHIDPNEFDNDLLNVIDEIIEYDYNCFEICLIEALIRNGDEEDISNYIYQLQDIGTYSATSNSFFVDLNNYLQVNHLLENDHHIEKLSIEEYYKLIDKELKLDDKNLSIDFSRWKRLLTFDFVDENERRFTDLSYGEKVLFGQMINFKYRLKEEEKREKDLLEFEPDAETFYHKPAFIFLIDEPDISLHPQWQKEYLSLLFDTLHAIEVNLHIVFTTHSPFLLSDIPKQNIIFLDTDENGNCKVVDGLNDKKQTFGQNIHTLLSDSFFMEDGLMGEFAKSKINEIIAFHKKVEEESRKEDKNLDALREKYTIQKDRFWQTQKIIGDDYLRQVIKNHLIEIEKILLGKDKAKEEEIKRTEEYLKKLKNDKDN